MKHPKRWLKYGIWILMAGSIYADHWIIKLAPPSPGFQAQINPGTDLITEIAQAPGVIHLEYIGPHIGTGRIQGIPALPPVDRFRRNSPTLMRLIPQDTRPVRTSKELRTR